MIPEEFDGETAAHGAITHSFNLGYSGMWPPESYYYLRQILALHPRRLRWVGVELMDYRFGQWRGRRRPCARFIGTMPNTPPWLGGWSPSRPGPLWKKVQLVAGHARLFLRRMANLGRGAEWLQERYFPSKKKSGLELDAASRLRSGREWRLDRGRARGLRAKDPGIRGRPARMVRVRPGFAVAVQRSPRIFAAPARSRCSSSRPRCAWKNVWRLACRQVSPSGSSTTPASIRACICRNCTTTPVI
ncbi:MAG: hypothetical protein WDN28_02600 [Chthoniobacter sp.]